MKIKKLLLAFLMLVGLCISISAKTVTTNASLSDNKIFKINGEEKISYLVGGVELHEQKIGALKDCAGNYYYDYDTFYLQTQANSENVKIVSWSYRNAEKWQMNGVSEIARNFEEHNPGWIVVGGTNADFFNINSNGQMLNTAMENGELINPDPNYSNPWWRGILGFTKDNELITGIPSVTNYYNLHVYTEKTMKNETKTIQVAGVNPGTLSETGITVITKDSGSFYDLTGYTVMEGKYDLVRRTDLNSFYLKGTITKVREGNAKEKPFDVREINGVNDYVQEFYLVAKDGSLDQLSIGDYIKCQKDYTGKYAEVYNSASYWWKILDEGTVMFEGHSDPKKREEIIKKYGQGYSDLSYVTCTKARCLFGVKADGSYVMTCISGSTSSGMTLSEAAYFMKEIGCVNAWDFDGGGSATIIARNDEGKIYTVNTPSDAGDGTERRVGNAILMVVRDSGFKVNNSKSTPSTVTLERKAGEEYSKMTNISITINNKEYKLTDDQTTCEIVGLAENTKYYATVKYTSEGENYTTTLPIVTNKYYHGVDIVPTSDGFNFNIWRTDEILYTSKIIAKIEDKEYVIDNADGKLETYRVKGLFKDDTYRISFTYTVTNSETGESFERTEAEKEYHTLSYSLPEITDFNLKKRAGNKVVANYTIEDEDGLVTSAYIMHNGEKVKVEVADGKYTFSDIDVESSRHSFKLVVEYETPDGKPQKVESEELTLGEEHVHEWVEATCTAPKTCKTCGATEGEALGHDWKDATTEAPKTCTRCGATEGEKLPTEKPKKNCKKTSLISILVSLTVLAGCLVIRKKH